MCHSIRPANLSSKKTLRYIVLTNIKTDIAAPIKMTMSCACHCIVLFCCTFVDFSSSLGGSHDIQESLFASLICIVAEGG